MLEYTKISLSSGGRTADLIPPETGSEKEDHTYDGHEADNDGSYDATLQAKSTRRLLSTRTINSCQTGGATVGLFEDSIKNAMVM